jgi:hypothetical protein
LVAVCFLFQEAAFAVPGAPGAGPAPVPAAPASAASAALPLSRLIQDPAQIPIPFDAVTLQEVHAGTSGKLIVHIQDAHANLSGQQSLAKAVEHFVAKYGIEVVLVEGADRDVTLDEVRKLAPLKEWSVIARRFLYEGIISGEEYLNLTTEHPMRLRGIEYQDLYDEAVRTYAALVDRRKDILHYLYQAKVSLDRLKAKMYPAELLEYEKQNGADDLAGGTGFADALKSLFALLPKSGLDLSEYPALAGLKEAMDREGTLDFDAANREQARILSRLTPEEARAFGEASRRLRLSQVSQYRLTRQLLDQASERGLDAASFPELAKYAEYLKRFLDLKMEQVMLEREKLEDRVFETVLPDDDARKVRAIDRFLGLLGNAYKLQMSSHEFGMHELNEKDFPTESWLAFMNRQLVDLGFFESMVPTEEYLEEARADFKKFYRLVSDRDGAFVENARRIMDEEKTDAAVLIAGGYHTEHLMRLLREEGHSYIVLTPLVTDATDHAKYEKILLQHLKGQERQLAARAASRTASAAGSGQDTGLNRAENVAATKIPRGIRSVAWTLSGGRMSGPMREFTDARSPAGADGARMSSRILETLGALFGRPANRRGPEAGPSGQALIDAEAAIRAGAEAKALEGVEARASIRVHPSVPEDLAERVRGVLMKETAAVRSTASENFNSAFGRLAEIHGTQDVLNAVSARPEEAVRMMSLLRPVELDNLLTPTGRSERGGLAGAVNDLGAEVIADASVSDETRALLEGLGIKFAPADADIEDPKARRFKLRVGGLSDGAPRQGDAAVLYTDAVNAASASESPVWNALIAMTLYDSLIEIEARNIAALDGAPMVLTHVTDYPPLDGWIRTTMTAKGGASPRYSVHFAVDAIVASHAFGNFDHAAYTTLHSFRDVLRANPGRFVGGQPSDVFFVGDVRLPDSSVALEGRPAEGIREFFDRVGADLKQVGNDEWTSRYGLSERFLNALNSRGYYIRRHEGSWARNFEAGHGYVKHPMRELFRTEAAKTSNSGPVSARDVMERIWADKFEPYVPKGGRYDWIRGEVVGLAQELAAISVLWSLPEAVGTREIEAFRSGLAAGTAAGAPSLMGERLTRMNIDPAEWDAIAERMLQRHAEVRADIRNTAEQILRSHPIPERSGQDAFLKALRSAPMAEERTRDGVVDRAVEGIRSDVETLSESADEAEVLLEAIEAGLSVVDRERSDWVAWARGQIKSHQVGAGYTDQMLLAAIRQRIEIKYSAGEGEIDSVMREAFGEEDWQGYRDAYLNHVNEPNPAFRKMTGSKYDDAIEIYLKLHEFFDELEAQGFRTGKGHFGKALYGWPKNLLTALYRDMGISGARMTSSPRVAQLLEFLDEQYRLLRRNISAPEPVLPEYATTYVAFLTPGDEGNPFSRRILDDGRVTSMISGGWVYRTPLDLNNSQEHSVSLRVSVGPAAGDPRMSEDFFNALDKLTWTHRNPQTGLPGLFYKYPVKPSGWGTRVDSMVFYLNSDDPDFVLKVAREISELAASKGYLREGLPVGSGEEVADGVFADVKPDERATYDLIQERAKAIDPDLAEAAERWLSRAFTFRSSAGQFEVLRTLIERLEAVEISLPARDGAGDPGSGGARMAGFSGARLGKSDDLAAEPRRSRLISGPATSAAEITDTIITSLEGRGFSDVEKYAGRVGGRAQIYLAMQNGKQVLIKFDTPEDPGVLGEAEYLKRREAKKSPDSIDKLAGHGIEGLVGLQEVIDVPVSIADPSGPSGAPFTDAYKVQVMEFLGPDQYVSLFQELKEGRYPRYQTPLDVFIALITALKQAEERLNDGLSNETGASRGRHILFDLAPRNFLIPLRGEKPIASRNWKVIDLDPVPASEVFDGISGQTFLMRQAENLRQLASDLLDRSDNSYQIFDAAMRGRSGEERSVGATGRFKAVLSNRTEDFKGVGPLLDRIKRARSNYQGSGTAGRASPGLMDTKIILKSIDWDLSLFDEPGISGPYADKETLVEDIRVSVSKYLDLVEPELQPSGKWSRVRNWLWEKVARGTARREQAERLHRMVLRLTVIANAVAPSVLGSKEWPDAAEAVNEALRGAIAMKDKMNSKDANVEDLLRSAASDLLYAKRKLSRLIAPAAAVPATSIETYYGARLSGQGRAVELDMKEVEKVWVGEKKSRADLEGGHEHFRDAVKYFNERVLPSPVMTPEHAASLLEKFLGLTYVSDDEKKSVFNQKAAAFRDYGDLRRVLSRSNSTMLLARYRKKAVIKEAAKIYRKLAVKQMMIGKKGFTEQPREDQDPANGHHRLAWFMMNNFLIRNGYSPFYFRNRSVYEMSFLYTDANRDFEDLEQLIDESGVGPIARAGSKEAVGVLGDGVDAVATAQKKVGVDLANLIPHTELTEELIKELKPRIGAASVNALKALLFGEGSAAALLVLQKKFWVSEGGQVWLEYTAGHRGRARNSLEVYRAAVSEGFQNLAEIAEPESGMILTRLAQSYSDEELIEKQAGLADLLVYMVRFGDDDHQVFDASQYERWAANGLDQKTLFNVHRKVMSGPDGTGSSARYLVIDPEHGRVAGLSASDWEKIRPDMAKKFNKVSVNEAEARAAIDRLTLPDENKKALLARVVEVLQDIDRRAGTGARMAEGVVGAGLKTGVPIEKSSARFHKNRFDDGLPLDMAVFGATNTGKPIDLVESVSEAAARILGLSDSGPFIGMVAVIGSAGYMRTAQGVDWKHVNDLDLVVYLSGNRSAEVPAASLNRYLMTVLEESTPVRGRYRIGAVSDGLEKNGKLLIRDLSGVERPVQIKVASANELVREGGVYGYDQRRDYYGNTGLLYRELAGLAQDAASRDAEIRKRQVGRDLARLDQVGSAIDYRPPGSASRGWFRKKLDRATEVIGRAFKTRGEQDRSRNDAHRLLRATKILYALANTSDWETDRREVQSLISRLDTWMESADPAGVQARAELQAVRGEISRLQEELRERILDSGVRFDGLSRPKAVAEKDAAGSAVDAYGLGARMAYTAGSWKVGSISSPEAIRAAMRQREGMVLEQLDRMGADSGTMEIAAGLLDVTRRIYERQGLAVSPNYHNHFHNLLVVHSALILSESDLTADRAAGEDPSLGLQDRLILMFAAALLHDFRIEAAPSGPAFTAADVTDSLTQVRKLMGLAADPLLVRSAFSLSEAGRGRYGKTFHRDEYGGLKASMGGLLVRAAERFGGTERFIALLQPMVRATDFPSDKPPVASIQTAEQRWLGVIRRAVAQSVSGASDASAQARRTLEGLRKSVRANMIKVRRGPDAKRAGIGRRVRQIGGRIGRVLGIQESYLKDLLRLPAGERSWIHRQSQTLVAADQLSYYLFLEPAAVENVVKALVLEGVVASADGTFPFFMSPQFLNEDVLRTVAALPVDVRLNFASVVDHFHGLSKASAKPFIAGHQAVVKYDSGVSEPGTRRWVRERLGLDVRGDRPAAARRRLTPASAYPLLRGSLLVSGSVTTFHVADQRYSIVLTQTPEGRVFRSLQAFGDAYVHGFDPRRAAGVDLPKGSISLLSAASGTGSRIVRPELVGVLDLARPDLAAQQRSDLRRMAQLARGLEQRRSVVIGLPAELHAALGEEALGRFSRKLREQNPGAVLEVAFVSYLPGGQQTVRSDHPGSDVILFAPSEPLSERTAPLFLGSGLLGYESDASGAGRYPNMARAIVFAVTLALEKRPADLQDRSSTRNLFGSPASGRALEAMKRLDHAEQIALVVNHSIPAELQGPELEAAFLSIVEAAWSA